MIPADIHNEVHVALMRRRSTVDLWGSALNNGYVGLIFCLHPTRNDVIITEIIRFFERNINLPKFPSDPKNIASAALFGGILAKSSQNKRASTLKLWNQYFFFKNNF